ncbi:YadA-like family protein, partial [Bartonella sp. A05]|uniref:YadA-like family protein n=1 Tax=Bartonella sp. A05 TaxID=2967261 RepID=UPI0022A9B49E
FFNKFGGVIKSVDNKVTQVEGDVKDLNGKVTKVESEVQGILTNSINVVMNSTIQAIKQDALLWDEGQRAFVAVHGSVDNKGKITSILDGRIASDSSDVITGSQLYSMGTDLAQYFGGGAKYEEGKWIAPTFKVFQVNADGMMGEKKGYDNVAAAFDSVNSSLSDLNDRIIDVKNTVEKKVDFEILGWNEKNNAYDAYYKGKASKIVNVARGTTEENATDVVNGGQLWEIDKHISDIENKIDNINTLLNGIDGAVNKPNNMPEEFVNYDKNTDNTKNNHITLKGGNESDPVVIDNLANGHIEKDSKEAVNGGQLHDYTQQQLDAALKEVNTKIDNTFSNAIGYNKGYVNEQFNILNYNIEDTRKEARQAAAIGLAVSNLRYGDIPGKLSLAVGSGLWRSQSAIAFGAGYTSENGNIRSNVSITSAGGYVGVGAGISVILNL